MDPSDYFFYVPPDARQMNITPFPGDSMCLSPLKSTQMHDKIVNLFGQYREIIMPNSSTSQRQPHHIREEHGILLVVMVLTPFILLVLYQTLGMLTGHRLDRTRLQTTKDLCAGITSLYSLLLLAFPSNGRIPSVQMHQLALCLGILLSLFLLLNRETTEPKLHTLLYNSINTRNPALLRYLQEIEDDDFDLNELSTLQVDALEEQHREYCCPIGGGLMHKPVMLDKLAYDYDNLLALEQNSRGYRLNPSTRDEFSLRELREARTLWKEIRASAKGMCVGADQDVLVHPPRYHANPLSPVIVRPIIK